MDGFNLFDGTNLHLECNSQQLISDELRFYDHNILKSRKEFDKIYQQIEFFKYKNQIELSKHFRKSIKI